MRRIHNDWNGTAQNGDLGSQDTTAPTPQQIEGAATPPPSATGPDGVVDAIPDDTSTTYSVTIGGAGASGWISPVGDHDWYAVTLTAGQSYVFTLNGSGGSPLQDTYLRVHTGAGTQVAFDDDGGPGTYSLISYTAPSSGTFYLNAGAFADSSSGQYTLSASLVEGAADSIAASTATTSTLTVGSSAYGLVNTLGDHDWYAINLTAGQEYQFSLSGFDGSPLGNATLNLRDASGALIAEGTSSSVSSLVTFAATSSGVYYLDAGGTSDASTGHYALNTGVYNGLIVNLIYDAAALAAPQSFRDGIQAAADILQSMIADNITVNLNITYSGTGGGASAGPDIGILQSYSQIRDILINTASPGDHTFDALPAGSTIGGQSQVVVWIAQLRALGLLAANDPSIDGSATFATDINPSLLAGVALHELTHALGRVHYGPQPDILEFFRFTAPGAYLFDGSTPATSSSYFSIDGGLTPLANFGVSSDPSDFLNGGGLTPNDPFNEFYSGSTSQNLTAVDLQTLNALGYHVFAASAPDLIAQSALLSGSQISFTVRNLGNTAAAASVAGIYLSSDSTVTAADILVTTSATNALPSFASYHVNLALAFSGAQAPGTYYLGIIADHNATSSEANETNNVSNVVPVILGDNNANTVNGTSGADSMFALAGADTLIGGAGDDTLFGGTGIDAANYASSATSNSWHRNPDGSWTINAGGEGTDTLTSVERAHFTDRDLYLDPAQQTFSGDGTSDILWRRSDGLVATWSMNGTTHNGSGNLGGVGLEWTAVGTGDFNGDGKDDIAWLRNDGLTAIWEMNGNSATLATGVIGGVGTSWHVAGIGDFNTDGKDDLLWKSDAGQYAIWDMNGFAASTKSVIGSVGAEWSVQAVADFNGDGSDDILWRRTDGLVALWNTNGTAQTGSSIVGSVGTDWSIVGTGDFNDDGRADILWQRTDGLTAIWEMNGASQIGSAVIGGVGTSWHVAGVGDYNGDGMDDIFWRNDSGLLAVWTMNGFTVTSTGVTGSVGGEWGII